MASPAESEVSSGLGTREPEAVRIGEGVRVAVRGAEERDDRRPGAHAHCADLEVHDRAAGQPVGRRDVSQELLDAVLEGSGITDELPPRLPSRRSS